MILGLRATRCPGTGVGDGDGIEVAAVRDPCGDGFRLIENPHFDAKAVR